MTARRWLLLLAWGAGGWLSLPPALSAQDLKIVLHENLITDYRAFLGTRSPGTVKDFTGLKRDLVELTLILQAVERSGVRGTVVLTGADALDRQKLMIQNGSALMNGTFWWLDENGDIAASLLASVPLLPSNSTFWGIYGLADNARLMGAKTKADLAGLRALTDPSWSRDMSAYGALQAKVDGVKVWADLKKMLAAGRADYTLLPFASGPEMSLVWESKKIVPVPGIKVGVPGDRGVVFSKAYPGAPALAQAIGGALGAMVQSGQIREAFRQAGFLDDPRIKNWTLVRVAD